MFTDNSDSRWLAEVFAAMIKHQENLQIQEAACMTLSNRIAANPELIKLIGEGDDNLLPLHRTVLAALNIHSGDIYVFRAACEAIYEMAINSTDLQKYLFAKGASSSIIKEMTTNSNEVDVQWWGCKALRALAHKNPYQAELMFIEDILSVIYQTLKTFKNVSVLQECIGLLVCLATDLPIMLRQCVMKEIPQLILRIGEENFESPIMVEIVLEAIGNFQNNKNTIFVFKSILAYAIFSKNYRNLFFTIKPIGNLFYWVIYEKGNEIILENF